MSAMPRVMMRVIPHAIPRVIPRVTLPVIPPVIRHASAVGDTDDNCRPTRLG